ncbi:MAG TPA: helix-turn-helix domain-containing protein [Tissierellaceae bacterium]|nr:helix-turn-helix domain-containing protein [Tissierellaceae bacterium]
MSTVKDTTRFFEMDNTPSEVFPELTQLQEYIIKEMAKGRTVTSIAKEMGVHVTTIQRRCKSIAFVNALHQTNNAKNELTLELCRDRLVKIVRTSQNEQACIKAVHELVTLFKHITLDELAQALTDETKSQEQAKKLLEDLGLSDEEDK